MKLTSQSRVKALLSDLAIEPSAGLGQNFLIDQNILDILLGTAALTPDDLILEIGPGLGTLTEHLIEKARQVVAVEKDRRLCDYLSRRFAGSGKFFLICGDFLRICEAELARLPFDKVVANLPYSAGSRMLVSLARLFRPPAEIVVTIQLEVAERLAAAPGGKDYGMLSVWMQLLYDITVCKKVSPTCFHPVPAVWSAIVRMRKVEERRASLRDLVLFYDLTKHAFQYRRKQLPTILSRAPGRLRLSASGARDVLTALGMAAAARPEDLSVADWCRLANALAESSP